MEFLAIDHINGGGNKNVKAGHERLGWNRLIDFRKMGWPEELKNTYRILCHNCNHAQGSYGYCPHKNGLVLHVKGERF